MNWEEIKEVVKVGDSKVKRFSRDSKVGSWKIADFHYGISQRYGSGEGEERQWEVKVTFGKANLMIRSYDTVMVQVSLGEEKEVFLFL